MIWLPLLALNSMTQIDPSACTSFPSLRDIMRSVFLEPQSVLSTAGLPQGLP